MNKTAHSGLFSLSDDILTLNATSVANLTQDCPESGEVSLDFKLTSELLGENEQTITVPVSVGKKFQNSTSSADSNVSEQGFDGWQSLLKEKKNDTAVEAEGIAPPKLQVRELKLSPAG